MKDRPLSRPTRTARTARRSAPALPAPARVARARTRVSFGIAAAALLLLGAGVAAWRRYEHASSPPASPAIALSSQEARLLRAAARAPRDPTAYRELAEVEAGSGRPVSALWAAVEAAARAPADLTLRLKLAE